MNACLFWFENVGIAFIYLLIFQMFRRRESILFLVIMAGIIILTLLQLDQINFVYSIGQIILYLLFVCTIIYAVSRLIKERRPLSFFEKSKPLLLALTIAGFFYLLSYLVETDGGKRRVIIGGLDHDLHFIHFQLFDDNQFKLLNSGPFGGNYYRGTYILRNDTLILQNDKLANLYPSLTLVLKQNEDKEKYFEPIDSEKSMYQLFIYKDLRENK